MQVKPFTEAIHIARAELLTRRVRACVRAFSRNRRWTTDSVPNIIWDANFAPPDLYQDLEAQLAALPEEEEQGSDKSQEQLEQKKMEAAKVAEAERRQREIERQKQAEQKAKVAEEETRQREMRRQREAEQAEMEKRRESEAEERARQEAEQEMEREKEKHQQPEANAIESPGVNEDMKPTAKAKGKGKAKQIEGDEDTPGAGEGSKKRRRVIKSKETVDDSDLEGEVSGQPPVTVKIPPPKRTRREIFTATLPPLPCERCVETKRECKPRGWHTACEACSKSRQTCTHAKLFPPGYLRTPMPRAIREAAIQARPPRKQPKRARVSPPTPDERLSKLCRTHFQLFH